jgi:anti-anti-sigma factor
VNHPIALQEYDHASREQLPSLCAPLPALSSGQADRGAGAGEGEGEGEGCILFCNDPETLRVRGLTELTADNSEQFGQLLRASLNGQTSIEIDLSRTTFMDCAGLGALIALRNQTRSRHGVVRLVHPTPVVRQLFDIMRADEVFEIVSPAGFHPMAPGRSAE